MFKREGFSKIERLTGEIRIASLFSKGKSFVCYPFRVVYVNANSESLCPVRILISVPKKKFKRAVDRNRVKRLIREAYRRSKHEISDRCNEGGKELHVAFIYLDDSLPDFGVLQTKMKSALLKLYGDTFRTKD